MRLHPIQRRYWTFDYRFRCLFGPRCSEGRYAADAAEVQGDRRNFRNAQEAQQALPSNDPRCRQRVRQIHSEKYVRIQEARVIQASAPRRPD